MVRPSAPDRCPVCPGTIFIRSLECEKCGTRIEGSFSFPSFFRLPAEDLKFLEIFIKNAGNLKEVQAELSLSYPTVKKQLDRIIDAMGYESPKDAGDSEEKKTGILDRLKNGELTADEALELLKKQ
ncbi:MAG: DUF2089 domain-containing protein [Oscillospiraceae bacterium]|nr:DUF2089 domain-containing protein [Oscillospiraceae bacterium]